MATARVQRRPAALGLWSGVGLVVANMVGAGVFLSAGYMAQELRPGLVLLAWLVGGVIALCGAASYAAVATAVPRSGGEYRFLSELLHPFLGYLAGWASLLVGFSAPVAISALAAGHFTATLFPSASPPLVASVLIVSLTLAHAIGLTPSRRTQDGLVLLKASLLIAFAAVGLAYAGMSWPQWTPPHPPDGSALPAFVTSLFYVAFAFSGWNAAAYTASEFEAPARDVPRAMLLGCLLVALLYLAVNWVFVATLTPERSTVVFAYERDRVTLGHLVMRDLLGTAGGRAMSALTLVALVSSISAMTFVGPRVYASMAADGFLPRFLAGQAGRPPTASVALQGALALSILFTHTLQQALQSVGGILTLFSALVAASVFRLPSVRPGAHAATRASRAAAAAYVASAVVMFAFAFRISGRLLLWVGVVSLFAGVAYVLTGSRRALPGAAE